MDLISKSEGLTHICVSILQHLDHKTLLSCQLVNSNFKRILDNPLFWIKILQNIYGLKKLVLDLASIAKHIGHSKHEYIRQKNHRYSKLLSTKLLDCLVSNSMCMILMEDLEESFTRSLMKFHKILNKENKTLFKSMTIDQFAASFGSMELIQLLETLELIRLLQNLDHLQKSNYLFNATYFGNFEAVKYFYNIEGYSALKNGRTPIHMASERGHLEIVRFFVQNCHNPNPRCENWMTPLYLASKYGNLDVVKYLLNHIDITEIFKKDVHGFTPIHVAVINGHLEVVKILAIFTENPNITCTSNKLTPIHMAAYYNHLEILKILVPLVKEPLKPNSRGWTALDIACQRGQFEIVKFLVPFVKNPLKPNSRGWNALDIADLKGHSEIVKFLSPVNEHPQSNPLFSQYPLYFELQENQVEENYFYQISFIILFVSFVLALFNLI